MADNYVGRGNNSGPATDLFPITASVASSPAVLITGTTAAAQTTVHTSDANTQDILYITLSNVGASSITAYHQLGSTTVTTGHQQTALSPGQSTVVFNGNATISKSGIYGIWSTATAGVYAFGYVARTYTATA